MLTAALAAALVATILLAAYMLSQRDKTISTLKGEVIIRTLAVRETRAKHAKAEQMLDDTELAAEVAREVIGSLEPMETPIFEGLVADQAEREATVLQFRRDLDGWGGSAS